MKIIHKHIFVCMLAAAVRIFVPDPVLSQGLPLMPSDPAVSTGVLPNGMSYYVVNNPTTKGVADFALIQMTGHQTVPENSSELTFSVAQDAVTELPRLGSSSPQAFLASHGVVPGKDGFVKVSENATLFHFRDVLISQGEAVVDSTLLVLFDIADRGSREADSFLGRWYAPADQAIIVSGDVTSASISEKLKLMSYMTPARESIKRGEYQWKESEEPVFDTAPYMTRNLATVSATWTFPRTPKEYMNTIQPAIYEMFVAELGTIAGERIEMSLREEKIPATDVSFQHITSVRSLGDEFFTISVSVSPEHAADAVRILASTMSSLDAGTATVHELEMARKRYVSSLAKRAANPFKSNSDYVERCASAFLYNSSLSSEREIVDFLRSRDLDPSTELTHFNNIAAALLDGRRNLTVECRVGGGQEFGSAHLESLFADAWSDTLAFRSCPAPLDSMPLPAAGLPLKLKSARKEPLSGGTVWTFSNGFKVIYKRQEGGRRMHYMLAMNGGYGNISGLSKGEGAYMTDYMNLCGVSGMTHDEFAGTLEQEDIVMDASVNLSNVLISGSAPERRLDLVMRALLGIVNEREHDQEAYEYYVSCQDVSYEFGRGSVSDRVAAIDSLMCPDYIYSSFKTPGKLTEGFPEKADGFLKYQSSKMNDGLLVLVGNIEETKLRKLIQQYVGGFSTTEREYPRTLVHYRPVAGSVTYEKRGQAASADFTISAGMSLTAENYMASRIASGILGQEIAAALDGTGMYMRLAHNCRIYPQERFNVMISLSEASEYGFSRNVSLTGADAAIKAVRNVLDGLAGLEVKAEDVEKYKAVLKGQLALEMTQPEYWIHAMAMRYLDGKNFTTGYEARIDAVTTDRVRNILASLSDAGRVEYIIRKHL